MTKNDNQKKTIVYEFADGTKSIVEVDAHIADSIEVSRREEENYERKCRYWTKVKMDYEGSCFADENTPSRLYELAEEERRVEAFLTTLTETQRRRLILRMDDPDLSLRDIARLEGVDIKTMTECFNAIKVKFNKFFNK